MSLVCIQLKKWGFEKNYRKLKLYEFDSDESEPSWLEPQLELKDFQLGSDRILEKSVINCFFVQNYAIIFELYTALKQISLKQFFQEFDWP